MWNKTLVVVVRGTRHVFSIAIQVTVYIDSIWNYNLYKCLLHVYVQCTVPATKLPHGWYPSMANVCQHWRVSEAHSTLSLSDYTVFSRCVSPLQRHPTTVAPCKPAYVVEVVDVTKETPSPRHIKCACKRGIACSLLGVQESAFLVYYKQFMCRAPRSLILQGVPLCVAQCTTLLTILYQWLQCNLILQGVPFYHNNLSYLLLRCMREDM
jgi:hypothetical protein